MLTVPPLIGLMGVTEYYDYYYVNHINYGVWTNTKG